MFGGQLVSAQEADLAVIAYVDAFEASVQLLGLIRPELAEDVLDAATEAEWPVVAGYVVNLLEGASGANYKPQYAIPDPIYEHGAIAYAETLAGTKAADYEDEGISALLASDELDPATRALLHLVYANRLLISENVNRDVLVEASHNVDQAYVLLQKHRGRLTTGRQSEVMCGEAMHGKIRQCQSFPAWAWQTPSTPSRAIARTRRRPSKRACNTAGCRPTPFLGRR